MANSANPEINKKIATSALGTLVIATVFFYLGDRYAETLVTYPGQIFDHLSDAFLSMWQTIKAILLIAGTNPLMDDKYDPHAHKRYRYIVDKRNWKRLHKNSFDFERYLKNGCEPYTPDEDTGAEFTAWKWAAWKKSRKGLLGKLLNR